MQRATIILIMAAAIGGCARAEATRTSANTLLVDAGAAPACGSVGAARVAAKTAAIETIRSGYERYIIAGSQGQNNVSVSQMPGQVVTSGTISRGAYQATSTYVPGPSIVSGTHDRTLSVVMFKAGEPGFDNAIDAKSALGPEWEELVKNGIRTCL